MDIHLDTLLGFPDVTVESCTQPEFGLSKTPEAMQLKGFTKTPSLSLWQ
jgi:hypothetical protein